MVDNKIHQANLSLQITPGGKLSGEITPPGDKSISHRAIMFGALANGVTKVTGFLQGEDALATLNIFTQMGVTIIRDGSAVEIHGVGLQGLIKPKQALDCGNSGTSMRLLVGLLAGQQFDSVLTGDTSLVKRPMRRVVDPLLKMDANIQTGDNGTAPLQIKGGQQLQAIRYQMPVASAQVKSCLLLAGLYASGMTTVIEPAPCRDHTERLLSAFGVDCEIKHNEINLAAGQTLTAANIHVPADISSAAFFIVGASIAAGSNLFIKNVGMNPTRIGVINILRLMGADIIVVNEQVVGGEPVADLQVKSAELHGIDIPESEVPLAIDEFPVIFIAAACAKGVTRLTGAEELRVKESDRIAAMAQGLKALGIHAQEKPDGIVIEGGKFSGGEIDSVGDHRIAMAFAMAGIVAEAPITISNCDNVATSFPNFVELASKAGLSIQPSSP